MLLIKVAELKAELEARGLETRGIKTLLATRLQEALDKEQVTILKFIFSYQLYQELEEDGPPESEAIPAAEPEPVAEEKKEEETLEEEKKDDEVMIIVS